MLTKHWTSINDGVVSLIAIIFFFERDFSEGFHVKTFLEGFSKVLTNLLGDPLIYHAFEKNDIIKSQALVGHNSFSITKISAISKTNLRKNFEDIAKEHGEQIVNILKNVKTADPLENLIIHAPYAIQIDVIQKEDDDLYYSDLIDPEIMIRDLISKILKDQKLNPKIKIVPDYMLPTGISKIAQFHALREHVQDFYGAFRPLILQKKKQIWQRTNLFNRISDHFGFSGISKKCVRIRSNLKRAYRGPSKPFQESEPLIDPMDVDEMDKLSNSFANLNFEPMEID